MKSARVHYGIAQTHYKLTSFSGVISEDSDNGVRRLINWKDRRTLISSEPSQDERDENTEQTQNSGNRSESKDHLTKNESNSCT